MTDPKTEPTPDDKQGDLAVVKDAPPPDSGGDDKAGLRSALTKQATDFNATIAKLQKQVDGHTAADLKTKEAKMIEDGKLNDLIAERDKTISDMTASAATSARSLLESSAREQLRNLGMSDPLYLTGAIAGLPADAKAETVEEWAKIMKADNASAFTAPVVKVGQASVGEPATDGGSADWKDVDARMKSDDPKEREQAREQMLKYYQEHGKFPD